MKETRRYPLDFEPDISLSRVYQSKAQYELGLTDLDIKDLLIILHLKTIRLYTKLNSDGIYKVVDDENGNIYYELNYEEFIGAYPLCKITEEDFWERLKKLENDKLISVIYDLYGEYYRSTKLTDEIVEVF